MYAIGTISQRVWTRGSMIASAGEGAVFLVEEDTRLLMKLMNEPLPSNAIRKLELLSSISPKPDYTALPIETLLDPQTKNIIGFLQPFYSRTVSCAKLLDSQSRRQFGFPDDLLFRVKLCRLLSEAVARVHSINIVIGDISDGNFLFGRDWFNRIDVAYIVDTNSFQISVRTNAGNEVYPSGVATIAYTAPEFQSANWTSCVRTIYSDSFGLSVLTWQILFNREHPFAVVSPRNVDVPSLGLRIEKRQFPFSPNTPLPHGWSAPILNPSLSILPTEIREMFFSSFSATDSRDRPTAEEWATTFRAWEFSLKPGIMLQILGFWNKSVSDWLGKCLFRVRPWAGKVAVFTCLVLLTLTYSPIESSPTSAKSQTTLPSDNASFFTLSDKPRPKSLRHRVVDGELFPELIRKPTLVEKE